MDLKVDTTLEVPSFVHADGTTIMLAIDRRAPWEATYVTMNCVSPREFREMDEINALRAAAILHADAFFRFDGNDDVFIVLPVMNRVSDERIEQLVMLLASACFGGRTLEELARLHQQLMGLQLPAPTSA